LKNRRVFSRWRNVDNDSADVTSEGRSSHVREVREHCSKFHIRMRHMYSDVGVNKTHSIINSSMHILLTKISKMLTNVVAREKAVHDTQHQSHGVIIRPTRKISLRGEYRKTSNKRLALKKFQQYRVLRLPASSWRKQAKSGRASLMSHPPVQFSSVQLQYLCFAQSYNTRKPS